MALKTKVEQETLDSIYLGQPYVEVSTTAIASQDLDTIFLGQPFVATDPPAGGVTQQGEADLTASATTTASGDRIRFGVSAVTATATASASGDRSRSSAVALSASSSVSASATKILSGQGALQSASNLTGDGVRTRSAASAFTSSTNVTVSASIVKQLASAQEEAFTWSAQGALVKSGSASLLSATDVSATAVRTRSVSAAFEEAAVCSATDERLRGFTSALEEAATWSAVGNRNASIDLVAFSASSVTASATRTRSLTSAMEEAATWSASGIRIQSSTVSLASTSSVSVSAQRSRRSSVALASAATVTANAGRLLQLNRTAKTFTVTGNASIRTVQSQFGGASGFFDGANDRIDTVTSADFGFGTGNITIEYWVRPRSFDANNVHLDFRTNAGDNKLRLGTSNTAASVFIAGSTILQGGTLQTNQWAHIAYTRSGNTHNLYVNGTRVATTTNSTNLGTSAPLRIGERYDATLDYDGYIDELRIIKGTALYTGTSLTVPTQEFVNLSGTVLLMHFNGANNSTIFTDDIVETESSLATVSANIQRTKQFSSALSSLATVSVTANITESYSAALTSTATVTALGGHLEQGAMTGSAVASVLTAAAKVGVVLVDLQTAFTVNASTSVTKSFASSLSSTSTFAANSGQLFEFATITGAIGVTPNSANTSILAPFVRATTATNPNTNTGNFVISFWAYCPQGTVFDCLPNSDGAGISILHSVSLVNGTGEQIAWSSYPPSEIYDPYGTFSTITFRTNNFGYHHYLIQVDTSKATNALRYRMFRDGIEHSLETATTNNFQLPIGNSYNFMMSTVNNVPTQGYGEIGDWYVGSPTFGPSGLTQFFLDYGGTYNIGDPSFRNKFYNLKDLGDDGTLTGLSQPKLYFSFDNKDDLTNGGSLGGSAVWKQYTQSGSPPNYIYTLNDYTATTSNNSVGAIRNINSAFDFNGSAESVIVDSAFLTSNSNFSATGRVNKGAVATVSATATLTGTVTRNRVGSAAINSEGFVLAAVAKVGSVVSDMPAQSAMTIDAVKVASASSALQSDTDTQAQAVKSVSATGFYTTDFQVLVEGETVRPFDAAFIVDTALTVLGGLVRDVDSDFNSQAFFTAEGTTGIFGSAALSTQSFLTADVAKFTGIIQNLASQFNLTADAQRALFGSATLLGNGFVLVAGRVISFDDYTTYVIEQETRLLTISPETRQWQIDQEDRQYVITEETREYLVEQSTAVNIS